jgi:hypothetical protein
MGCPQCRSEYLVIRQKTGLEWLILQFTKLRKYHCVQCGHSFRAPDRRKTPRPEGKVLVVRPEHFRPEHFQSQREEERETSDNNA